MIEKIKEIMKMPFGKEVQKGFFYKPIDGDAIKIGFYVPSSKVDEFNFIREQSNKNMRVPDESDSGKLKVPAIVLLFKGNGKWLTYAGQSLISMDFGKISAVYGIAYDRTNSRPMRFKRGNCHVLIHK